MRKYLVLVVLTIFSSIFTFAQAKIYAPSNLQTTIPTEKQQIILNALDTLLIDISKDSLRTEELNSYDSGLTRSILYSLKDFADKNINPRLINLYPVAGSRYFISLAYINGDSLKAVFNLTGSIDNNKVRFSIPLKYLTRNWKTVQTGLITYHYDDTINLERAREFDFANAKISGKLGVKPESFDFYLCSNYQEILTLLGYTFDSQSAGKTTNGYFTENNIIFSIMHNENFAHDIFHYYAEKIRTNKRNSAAEEGIAYSWGNAYYTDELGEMITQKQLVILLKQYLQQNPNADLLELFTKNPKIFDLLGSIRSLLSSLVCDEVERKEGIAGIKKMINCGKGDDNYFRAVNEMIGINPANFNNRVMELIMQYP
jgi:hypothetical protein